MLLHEVLGSTGPNGFHDTRFRSVYIDWVSRQVSIECDLWVGDLDATGEAEREARRHGVLTLTGLLYLVIEPPDPSYPFEESPKGLDITSDGAIDSLNTKPTLPLVTDEEAFAHYFWVNDWNAFIFVAAKGARFEWEGHC